MKQLKLITKWVLFAAFLLSLFAFTFIANQKRNIKQVDALAVEFANQNLGFVQKDDIYKLFPDSDSLNYGIVGEIQLKEIEQKVAKNPYVEKCEAYINNSEQLTIKVRQKEPLFRVFHQNGVSYYVDNSGIKFPVSPTFTPSVPIVSGRINYAVDSLGNQEGQAIKDLIKFFEFVNEHEVMKALVSHVEVKSNSDIVFTPRTGKHIVNMGSPTDLEDKTYRLLTFYKEGLNKVGWDEYSEISVKYKNQVIAKKKKL